MPEKRLLCALWLSILAHVSLLAWQSTDETHTSSHRRLDFKLSQKQPTKRMAMAKDPKLDQNSDELFPAIQETNSIDEIPNNSPNFPGRVALGSNELDSPLILAEELALEPDGGYPAELEGKVRLDLLISEQGEVVWIGMASSDINASALQFIVGKFSNAKFSIPRLRGQPTKVLIQIEILIGAKTND